MSFRELIKRASSYLRLQLHHARLDLTRVTDAQLLVKKATRGRIRGPDARTLKRISRAAFEIRDYWRIVGVLHKRLERMSTKRWRKWYQALVVLEHLVIHGPESAAREFQPDSDAIQSQAAAFHYIDEGGFDWGMAVRKRSETVLELLEGGPLLREERERARSPIKGTQVFGSGDLCSPEVTSPHVVGECGSTFLFVANDEKDRSLGKGGPVEAKQRDPRSCGHPAVEETAAWAELEGGQEIVLWRRDTGSEAVTESDTYAAGASVFPEESMPLLANDSLAIRWFWIRWSDETGDSGAV